MVSDNQHRLFETQLHLFRPRLIRSSVPMAKEMSTYAVYEKKLQAVYEKKSSSSRLILIRQLFNMRMKESQLKTSRINTFSRLLAKLSSQGLNFKDEIKVLALLKLADKLGGILNDVHK